MKLVDKVVLFVFSSVLIAYIFYVRHSKTSIYNQKKSVPLLKDRLVFKPHDVIVRKVVDAVKPRPPQKKAKAIKKRLEDSFLKDQILQDNLKISYHHTKTQINIIEENEKALVYWSFMSRSGLIKKSGNTLILFSSRLDLTLPTYSQHYPLYRVPKTNNEMLYVLQSKGSYVMKAILTGMISRIIWVRPLWAVTQLPKSSPYQKQSLEVGIYKVNNDIKYCLCRDSKCNIPKTNKSVPVSKCQSRLTVTVDSVKETSVLTKAKDKTWLPKDDILLHVDALYFGSLPPSKALRTRIPEDKAVEKISSILEKSMCPKSIQDEVYLDRLMLKAIEYSQIDKECKANHTAKVKTGPFEKCLANKKKSFKMETEIYDFLRRKLEKSHYICGIYTSFHDFLLKELSSLFVNRKTAQLQLLKLSGFCMTTTVRAVHHFGICQGSKGFGQDIKFSPSHLLTTKEIKLETELLSQFMKTLPVKGIKTVTYCRNVRHGYAPRFLAMKLEASILKTLYLLNKDFMINYDLHLLGHKQGWYFRTYLKDTL